MWIFYLRDYYYMKILGVLILGILISVVEIYLTFNNFQGARPFPWNEVLYMSADHIARDILVLAICLGIYKKRKDILKCIKEFIPVTIVGALYLCAATFMVYRLSLDFGLQTFLSVLAGTCNNILIVLISALVYHKWKNKTAKWVVLHCLYFHWTSNNCRLSLFLANYNTCRKCVVSKS